MGGGVSSAQHESPKKEFENIQECDKISNVPLIIKKGASKELKSVKSLRALALRQHSKQDMYTIQGTKSFTSNIGSFSSSSVSTSYQKSESDTNKKESIEPLNESIPSSSSASSNSQANTNVSSATPVKMITKPNLKIQISDVHDDPDWIQVSDDDGEGEIENSVDVEEDKELPSRMKGETLNKNKSYLFTQSGTIFVDGFSPGIGKAGIAGESEKSSKITSHKLPMKQRLCVLCKLGQGASGVVYKALDLSEMRLVAVKMISVFDRTKRRQMVRELSALFHMLRVRQSEFKHKGKGMFTSQSNILSTEENNLPLSPEMTTEFDELESQSNIVDFYDAFSNLEDGGVALMMEYLDGGSLQDIVDHGGCDEEPTLANIAKQALQGLHFLHSCNQIHRDIKPGNLLIDQHGIVKVSDLGILRQLHPDLTPISKLDSIENSPDIPSEIDSNKNSNNIHNIHRASTFVGTATYMAPERIDGQEYSFSSDIWSLGLTLITVALGKMPFDTKGGYWSILHSIRTFQAPVYFQDCEKFSPEFCDFISLCLRQNPLERPNCLELLNHSFIGKSYIEDINDGHTSERGTDELKLIIAALHTHLDKLKREIKSPLAEDLNIAKEKESFITRALRNKSAAELIYDTLILKDDNIHPHERLQRLARQLRIHPQEAVDSATQFCKDLLENRHIEFIPDWTTTPKASHQTRKS